MRERPWYSWRVRLWSSDELLDHASVVVCTCLNLPTARSLARDPLRIRLHRPERPLLWDALKNPSVSRDGDHPERTAAYVHETLASMVWATSGGGVDLGGVAVGGGGEGTDSGCLGYCLGGCGSSPGRGWSWLTGDCCWCAGASPAPGETAASSRAEATSTRGLAAVFRQGESARERAGCFRE